MQRSRFYLVTVCAMAFTCFWGFSGTYLVPVLLDRPSVFGRTAADMPVLVHLHGWTFFAWYVLMVVQATLVATRRVALHRAIGAFSVVLVAAMVLAGVAVLAISAQLAAAPNGSPLFRHFGQLILAGLVLFAIYYVLALRHRRVPDVHKRWMLAAGAVGLGAAMFRILFGVVGPSPLNVPLGVLLTNGFIVAGMLHDRHTRDRVHPVYRTALLLAVGTELLFTALPHTPPGAFLQQRLCKLGEALMFLYGPSP